MARKKKQRIGFDPLAWMKGDDASTVPAAKAARGPKAADATASLADANAAVAAPHTGKTPLKETPIAAECSASDSAPRVVNIGGALTIPNAAAMHAELRQALESAHAIVLDAAAVETVDTAGLQLLSVFVRAARDRGITTTWREPSGILRDGAKRLDLEKILRFPG